MLESGLAVERELYVKHVGILPQLKRPKMAYGTEVGSPGRSRSENRIVRPKVFVCVHTTFTDMATSTRDDPDEEGVEFIHEDDGSITARDKETGVASYGDTKAEALRMLAEALTLHEGGGEPVSDEDLREMGLDPEDTGDEELPEFMQ
jgi:predicted RNase H-like HicB family nuclease